MHLEYFNITHHLEKLCAFATWVFAPMIKALAHFASQLKASLHCRRKDGKKSRVRTDGPATGPRGCMPPAEGRARFPYSTNFGCDIATACAIAATPPCIRDQ